MGIWTIEGVAFVVSDMFLEVFNITKVWMEYADREKDSKAPGHLKQG